MSNLIQIKKIGLMFFVCCIAFKALGQITSAKILFERKTNLYKKFKDENTKRWIKEEDKIKIDFFELYISDTLSLFKPQESELSENMGWTTTKNTIYQNFNSNKRYCIKNMWGEELHLIDSLYIRKWKITENTRKIAGYHCRKAIWQANDSTRIYAWFSYDLTPSTGPESFNGLPGTILGLATEDGGVIYFAKTVELIKPLPAQFILPKKKKIQSVDEVKKILEKQYGKEKWFKREIYEQFGIW